MNSLHTAAMVSTRGFISPTGVMMRTIHITGEDKTPPQILWVKVRSDNTIQVKVIDGGNVKFVKVNMRARKPKIKNYYPKEYISFTLNDDGDYGDNIKGDNVFSLKVPEQGFGLYDAEVEAADIYGNMGVKKFSDAFVIY